MMNDKIFKRKSKESFVYNSSSQGPMKTRQIMHKQAKRLVYTVEKCVMNKFHLRTHSSKIHKNLAQISLLKSQLVETQPLDGLQPWGL